MTKELSKGYILDLSEWVEVLTPPTGWELEKFDPNMYYITSGDAIQKAKRLYKDAYSYAGRARKILKGLKRPGAGDLAFEAKCWKEAGQVHKLKIALERARGDAVFMETEWIENVLLIIRKWPRIKK